MVAGHPPHGGLRRPGQHVLLLCMLKRLCKCGHPWSFLAGLRWLLNRSAGVVAVSDTLHAYGSQKRMPWSHMIVNSCSLAVPGVLQ